MFPVTLCAYCEANLDVMGDRILRVGKQSRAEQRFVIKYFTAQDKTPANIWTRLRRVHGAQTLSHSAVRNWYLRFKRDPNASCLDRPCCGGPAFARSRGTIAKSGDWSLRTRAGQSEILLHAPAFLSGPPTPSCARTSNCANWRHALYPSCSAMSRRHVEWMSLRPIWLW